MTTGGARCASKEKFFNVKKLFIYFVERVPFFSAKEQHYYFTIHLYNNAINKYCKTSSFYKYHLFTVTDHSKVFLWFFSTIRQNIISLEVK